MSGKIIKTYSEAFKRQVVSDLENGGLTFTEAKTLYGIKGGNTIQNWVRKFGKYHLLNRVVKIQVKEEVDQIKKLTQEKKKLESALATSQVKIYALEELIELAKEDYGIDLKKNSGQKQSSTSRKKSRKVR